MPRLLPLAVLLPLIAALALAGQPPIPKDPPKPKTFTPEQQAKLKERDALAKQRDELARAGKVADVIAAVGKILVIEEEVFGAVSQEVADTQRVAASYLKRMGRWDAARAAAGRWEELAVKLHGKDAWQATDARLAKQDIDRWEKLSAADRAAVRTALKQNQDGVQALKEGKTTEAEQAWGEALAVLRKHLGDGHQDTLTVRNNLAHHALKQDERAEAARLFEEVLAGRRKVLGDAHPKTLETVRSLRDLYLRLRDPAGIERVARLELATAGKEIGGKDSGRETAHLQMAAQSYDHRRKSDDAIRLYAELLAAHRKEWKEWNVGTTNALLPLVELHRRQGKLAEVSRLSAEGLIGEKQCWTRMSLLGRVSEGGFTGHSSYLMGQYLSAGITPAQERYAKVLALKGMFFTAHTQLRAAILGANDPEVTKLFDEAGTVTRQLATLASTEPADAELDSFHTRLQQLTKRRQELERELALKSAPFRKASETAALTPDQLAQALPPDVALVDFIQYGHHAADPDKKLRRTYERRYLAYVVRNGKPVVEVELKAAEPINRLVTDWLDTRSRRVPARGDDDPAVALRKAVWEPIAKHLGDAKVVLVSPDGALARLPFAALPGADPKKYLIEEVAVAVAPIPQLIPEMLADRPKSAKDPALLLVGDVDYDASPGKPAKADEGRTADRAGGMSNWQRLDATRDEVVAIRDSFEERFPDGRVKVLRKGEATEAAIRAQAGKNQFLHVATHAFFAPPKPDTRVPDRMDPGEFRSRAGATHPGLLSGLVLAGANKPPAADADDGILTALEVAELDLRGVELAVLSACETKLGKEVSGEGVIGLERAFRSAGARTVVASLWKVPDRPTQQLMSQFYRNLWEKNLGRLDALRQAQLWMLREGDRGATADDDKNDRKDNTGRTAPQFWAAFTLSGDWR